MRNHAPVLGLAVSALFVAACSSAPGAENSDGVGGEGQFIVNTGGSSTSVGSNGQGGRDAQPCDCYDGDGDYCAADVSAHGTANGCVVSVAAGHEGAVLHCEAGSWSVANDCAAGCETTPNGYEHCKAQGPVCDCYSGNGDYCGSLAAEHAANSGCEVPVSATHEGDVLTCTDGAWDVKEACADGCTFNPNGGDYCLANSTDGYRLPWTCGESYEAFVGNFCEVCGGGCHHGPQDVYAWDFELPRHTVVRAVRGGVVKFSSNVVQPGDPCWDGCPNGPDCNHANYVVVDHGDGAQSLYLHLDEATVGVGTVVAQGDMVGYSGTSGCSNGPHLHFKVAPSCGGWYCDSLPISFEEAGVPQACDVPTSQNACP